MLDFQYFWYIFHLVGQKIHVRMRKVEKYDGKWQTPYKHLHAANAHEQSCMMMIMEDSKMSQTEYDLIAWLWHNKINEMRAMPNYI